MHDPFQAEFTVESYLHGVRVDSFLARHLRNYSAARLQRLIAAGQVRVDHLTALPDTRVRRGESVRIRLLEPPDKLFEPEPLPIDILYEDPWMIAVNKPVGQVAHPCGQHYRGSLCHALQHHLDRQTPLAGLLRPGIIHRLDRMTSGVLVVSKEHYAHRRLSIAWQTRHVTKTYLALVHGVVPAERGSIEFPIGNVPGGRSILMSTAPDAVNARPARTSFEVVERFASHTLLRAQPFTGRMHQIRVHCAAMGHPVVADEFYGPGGYLWLGPAGLREELERRVRDEPRLMPRQALHAASLRMAHPVTRSPLHLDAAPPGDFQAALAWLRGEAGPPEVSPLAAPADFDAEPDESEGDETADEHLTSL